MNKGWIIMCHEENAMYRRSFVVNGHMPMSFPYQLFAMGLFESAFIVWPGVGVFDE